MQEVDTAVKTLLEQLVAKSREHLRAPWEFGEHETPRGARWLLMDSTARKDVRIADEDRTLTTTSPSWFTPQSWPPGQRSHG